MTDSIAEKAINLGCQVTPTQDRVDHLIGIRLPNGVTGELGERLADEKIYVSICGDALRIAPYLYNNEQDIEKLFSRSAKNEFEKGSGRLFLFKTFRHRRRFYP